MVRWGPCKCTPADLADAHRNFSRQTRFAWILLAGLIIINLATDGTKNMATPPPSPADLTATPSTPHPEYLQADINTRLETGFTKARAMLQPAQYPDQDTRPIPRVTRMQEAAAQLNSNGYPAAKTALADVNVSFRAHTNAAGVAQPACSLCGDCNSGCNVGA